LLFVKLSDIKLLYVCTDFPYPPTHGGKVDMWNRIQALHSLGVTVDLVATPGTDPSLLNKKKVEAMVRSLLICYRKPTRSALFALKPGAVVIRQSLRDLHLTETYDVVLLQTQFTSEILQNRTLRYQTGIIRIENDEVVYLFRTARSEASPLLKLYYLWEALRTRLHTEQLLPKMNALWFISNAELRHYNDRRYNSSQRQRAEFLPSAADFSILDRPPLQSSQVLFVGNLWTSLNREAVEWYVRRVHPLLCNRPTYELVIAGSTDKGSREWLKSLIRPFGNIKTYFDVEDLSTLYRTSAVFVNPMRRGAGVKLKTIEAVVRGLPVVSTAIGAEGSGLVDGEHYKGADSADAFADSISQFLDDRSLAKRFVSNAQEFVRENYDQRKVLERLLKDLCDASPCSST
jgi:glycosyltransferase involved in cell wall biosynthesis